MEANNNKDQILKNAAGQNRLQHRLKLIFDSWPNLRNATYKFMDYVHVDLRSNDGSPLLSKCILSAVTAYEQCPPEKVGSTTQMFCYLNGLLKHAHEIVNFHVANDAKPPQSWEPFSQSILDFIASNKNAMIHDEKYAQVDPNSIRLMLLARIITIKDLNTIEKCNPITEFFENEHLAAH
jgi:hypothetical protein